MTSADALVERLDRLSPAEWKSGAAWRACADAGFTSFPVDPAHGGRGASLLETAESFAAFGRAGAPPGLLFALGAQLWSMTMTVDRFGSDEQHANWLPQLCTGEVVAGHAMTEPSSGSDAFALTTTATVEGDKVTLDGVKTFVTNGPDADLFLVFATANRNAGWAGLSAYLVERGTDGLTVGPALRTMSPASAGLAELTFDRCVIPASARIGSDGSGLAVFTTAMELERSLLAAGQIGLIEHRLTAIARSNPGSVVADRVARLRTRSMTAWALVRRATAEIDRRGKAPKESSLAKLAASELWKATANLAVDAAGAFGMLAGSEIDLGDAVAACVYSGTSEIQREVLGRRLGLPA